MDERPRISKNARGPWPVQTPILQQGGEMERRHVNAVIAVSPADVGNAIDMKNFSSLRNLIRVTVWIRLDIMRLVMVI